MFPDTSNFTDPGYTDMSGDPCADGTCVDYTVPDASTGGISVGLGSLGQPGGIPLNTGGAASNTPAQGQSVGAKLFGWLNLGNNIAQTVTGQARTGYSTRPGVNKKPTSLGGLGTMTTTTLIVIIAVFFGAIWLLSKK